MPSISRFIPWKHSKQSRQQLNSDQLPISVNSKDHPGSMDDDKSNTPTLLQPPTSSMSEKSDLKTFSKSDPSTSLGTKSDLPPLGHVSFLALYQYATKMEIALNILGIISAIGAGSLQPFMALIFGRLTNNFIDFTAAIQAPGSQMDLANLAYQQNLLRSRSNTSAVYLVVIGAAMLISTMIYMQTWSYTAENISKRIRERYLSSVLRQEIGWFDTVGAGEIASRIQTDTHLIHTGISEKVPLAVSFIATFVTGFAIAFIRQPKLAGVLCVIIPIVAVTATIMNYLMAKTYTSALTFSAQGGTLIDEVISSIRTCKAFSNEDRVSRSYEEIAHLALKQTLKTAWIMGIGLGIFFFTINGSYGLAFYYGTTLILIDEATVGSVVSCFLSILIGSFTLVFLAPEVQAIAKGMSAAAKVFQTIEAVPGIDSFGDKGDKPSSCEGNIVFESVNFTYPARPDMQVLYNFTSTFSSGQMAAAVGESGSGKSTILALLLRFYDPDSGVIKLDGRDIRSLNVKWLRNQLGYVSQEPILFGGSISDNIAMGLIGSKYAELNAAERTIRIRQAADIANATGFIELLPRKFDSDVGQRGALLSGGQRQKIAIARAIVGDPKILLLDEATSALDSSSEEAVQAALDKAIVGRTTISVAHRLSTICDAKEIIVMGSGKVLQRGTHEELMSDAKGKYAKLVEAQSVEYVRDKSQLDAIIEDDIEILEDQSPQDLPSSKSGRMKSKISMQSLKSVMSVQSVKSAMTAVGMPYTQSEQMAKHSYFTLFKRMYKLNRSAKWFYIAGGIAGFSAGGVAPMYGLLFAITLEGYTAPRDQFRHNGNMNALWYLCLAVAAALAMMLQTFFFTHTSESLAFQVRSRSLRKLLQLDVSHFDEKKNSTGALTASISENASKLTGLAGPTLGTIVQSFATVLIGSVVGLAYHWKFALVGVATLPGVLCAGYIRLRVVVLKDKLNEEAHSEAAQVALESAASIKTVASLTSESHCVKSFATALEEPRKRTVKAALRGNLLFALTQALSFWVIALMFWYGSRLLADFSISLLDFYVVIMSTTFASIQAGNAFAYCADMSSAKGAAESVLKLLDTEISVDAESNKGEVLENVSGHIEFKNVKFRYPTRPEAKVLKGISFIAKPGQTVALVGQSGSGKSTVVQLLERFYDSLDGEVLVDGNNVKDLQPKSLRNSIALVSQEPTLYAGSIRYNVVLGATEEQGSVTQQQIEEACRAANIWDFILTLPHGLDTEVGGKGAQLSGGQKQRIAIARALIRNPKILLLDEATAALDSSSEKVVQAALDAASTGRTTIVVAHRLKTIANADCILVFENGQIVQQGDYNSLMMDSTGRFARTANLQDLSKRRSQIIFSPPVPSTPRFNS